MLERRKKDGTLYAGDKHKLEQQDKAFIQAFAQKEYQKYIGRKAFQELRKKCVERDGHKCMFCARTEEELKEKGKYLQAHHRSYSHLGKGDESELNDLISCCSACHRGAHSILANKSRFKDKTPIIKNLNLSVPISIGARVRCTEDDNEGIVLDIKNNGAIVLFDDTTETWLPIDLLERI